MNKLLVITVDCHGSYDLIAISPKGTVVDTYTVNYDDFLDLHDFLKWLFRNNVDIKNFKTFDEASDKHTILAKAFDLIENKNEE